MNDEVWKEIPSYEGFYMVSNIGRVRSLVGRWGRGRILKGATKDGYHTVVLSKYGVRRDHRVPPLVAAAFLGPRPDGLVVCHNNGVRTDDRAENLRYDTRKADREDMELHGTRPFGETHPMHKLTEVDVRRIRSDKRIAPRLAEEYGVTRELIYYIRNGKLWKHVQ